MNYRITTNGLFSQYRSQLHASQGRLNDAMTHVETGRNFNRYYEDPGTASMSFNLRRSYWRTGDQIDNSNYVISKLQTGYNALEPVVDAQGDGSDLSTISESLRALNGAMGSARSALGLEMLSVADSVMRVMNVRYNDEFVFAGADGLNVPFSFQENEDGTKTLLYRGVDVDLNKPPMPDQFGLEDMTVQDDYLLSEEEFEQLDEDGKAALAEQYSVSSYDDYKSSYQDVNGLDDDTMAKLDNYAAARDAYMDENAALLEKSSPGADYRKIALRFDETVFVDIGLGMQFNDKGRIESASAFNAAVSGLDVIGYGVDEDGDPKNLVSLINELGTLFSKCDPKSGAYPEPAQENEERANVLTQKVRAAIDKIQNEHVALSSKVEYLQTNMGQLQDRKVTLNEQIETAEQMDPADAITSMLWAQYSYNAAMRIGNQILSQSLLDFIS